MGWPKKQVWVGLRFKINSKALLLWIECMHNMETYMGFWLSCLDTWQMRDKLHIRGSFSITWIKDGKGQPLVALKYFYLKRRESVPCATNVISLGFLNSRTSLSHHIPLWIKSIALNHVASNWENILCFGNTNSTFVLVFSTQ